MPQERVVPIEFAGWLPCFAFFGNCGQHPLFAHTEAPPAGYRFVRSKPKLRERQPIRSSRFLNLARAVWTVGRPFFAIIREARKAGIGKALLTLVAVIRLFITLRRAGCAFGPTAQFLRTRHFASQVLLPTRPNLVYLTSIPFTFGQHPWVIEIEDVATLFFPFHLNGCTARTDIRRSPYLPIIKTVLELDSCRGIITHMRSTAEALPKLFDSPRIAAKTSYVPCATALPPAEPALKSSEYLDLLFTCSWYQNSDSFFLRGGLDVLRAFEVVQERYPHVRLTLRTSLPELKPRFRKVLEKCWVRVIDRFLPDEEMDELLGSSHVFLLPAARIHVVSVLRAMAHAQAVVVSDGWGFGEYVEHERNGLIVPGRHDTSSWMDEAGMLRENYFPLFSSDSAVTRGLVEAISALVERPELRRRLGRQARHDVATRYNLTNWNRGLARALNRALGRPAMDVEATHERMQSGDRFAPGQARLQGQRHLARLGSERELS